MISAERTKPWKCAGLQATSRWPQREKLQSIFSSATICSTQSIEARDAAYKRAVVSRPYFASNCSTPSLRPVRTMPPLRELAPQPGVSASRTATRAPRLARTRAEESPVIPAPITATSTDSGKGRERSPAGIEAVSSQKQLSRRAPDWEGEFIWAERFGIGRRIPRASLMRRGSAREVMLSGGGAQVNEERAARRKGRESGRRAERETRYEKWKRRRRSKWLCGEIFVILCRLERGPVVCFL